MMTDDQILEVVQARKEGKKLEFCHNEGCVHYWYDFCGAPSWNFEKFTYRVVPEPRKPREWNVVVDEITGDVKWGFVYDARFSGGVRVREVLE